MSGKKKTLPEEALGALEEAALDAELARIKALSDDEVSVELRKAGGDPDAIGRRGQEIAERAANRPAWMIEAARGLTAERARWARARAGLAKTRGLTREELLARIEEARNDPRFGGEKVSVMFRNRKPGPASIEELEAILADIETLALLREEREKKPPPR